MTTATKQQKIETAKGIIGETLVEDPDNIQAPPTVQVGEAVVDAAASSDDRTNERAKPGAEMFYTHGMDIDYTKMSLGMRAEMMRRERSYIQTDATGSGAPFKNALSHSEVLKQLRPLAVKWGVRWAPVRATVEATDRYESTTQAGKVKQWNTEVITYRFLFFRTEYGQVDQQAETVEITMRGLDDQDKGPAKASTNAEKFALARWMNLEYGEDPDFTPTGMETDVPPELEERILKIRTLACNVYTFNDPSPELDGYLRSICVSIAKKYSRPSIKNIFALSPRMLDEWIGNLEKQPKANQS